MHYFTIPHVLAAITVLFAIYALMKPPQTTLRTIGLLLLALAFLFMTGCGKPKLSDPATFAPNTLVSKSVTAVAKHYGGESAGQLASDGLYATATVLQGYVDKKPPLDIIADSPGVQGMGAVMVNWLKNKGYVTQNMVNNIHKAAAIAANITNTPNVSK